MDGTKRLTLLRIRAQGKYRLYDETEGTSCVMLIEKFKQACCDYTCVMARWLFCIEWPTPFWWRHKTHRWYKLIQRWYKLLQQWYKWFKPPAIEQSDWSETLKYGIRVIYKTARFFCSCGIGRQTRYRVSNPIANVQKFHWIAAPTSSAVAPIIWSIMNGSMFVQMRPRPKRFINCDTHNMIIAGIWVLLNCNVRNAIKNVKNATVSKKNPAIIPRYLPSSESPTYPTTGT